MTNIASRAKGKPARGAQAHGTPNRGIIAGVGVKSVGEESEINHLHCALGWRATTVYTPTTAPAAVSTIPFPDFFPSRGKKRVGARAFSLARFNESFYGNRTETEIREIASQWRRNAPFN